MTFCKANFLDVYKSSSVTADVSSGRAFQILGSATVKALLPTVESLRSGTSTRRMVLAECTIVIVDQVDPQPERARGPRTAVQTRVGLCASARRSFVHSAQERTHCHTATGG